MAAQKSHRVAKLQKGMGLILLIELIQNLDRPTVIYLVILHFGNAD